MLIERSDDAVIITRVESSKCRDSIYRDEFPAVNLENIATIDRKSTARHF